MKSYYLSEDNEILKKSKSNMKWIILALSCTALMGNYYCFDNPGVIHSLLKARFDNINSNDFEVMFNLLYTVYSLPNILLPILGGILILKFGYRIMFLIFSFLIIFGQFLFASGCSFRSINTMLFGRIIFGLGGESLTLARFSIIIQWFSQRELGFTMGICMGLAKICSLLNYYISPFISNVTSSNSITNEVEEKPLKEIVNFPRMYFYLIFLCLVMYGAIFPFNYFATSFLMQIWHNNIVTLQNQNNVNFYLGLPFIMSSFMIPLFGKISDIYGKKGKALCISVYLGLISVILFLLISPIIPLMLLGISYSLFAANIWPSIAFVVSPEILGLAMGLAVSLENTGLLSFPKIIEFLLIKTTSYNITILFFIFLMILGVILSFIILFEDKSHSLLECLGAEKDQIDEAENDIENDVNKVFSKVEFKNDDLIKHMILR